MDFRSLATASGSGSIAPGEPAARDLPGLVPRFFSGDQAEDLRKLGKFMEQIGSMLRLVGD